VREPSGNGCDPSLAKPESDLSGFLMHSEKEKWKI
jgi:hypothetical protein